MVLSSFILGETMQEKNKIELKELRPDLAGNDLFEMFQEIPKLDEFQEENNLNGVSKKLFPLCLEYMYRREYGFELSKTQIPTINFILYINNFPVGVAGLRPKLNDFYKKHGGHIWYKIRPSERKKGYGTKILELVLERAKWLGISEILMQCNVENIGSIKVMENNNLKQYKKDNKSISFKKHLSIKKITLKEHL